MGATEKIAKLSEQKCRVLFIEAINETKNGQKYEEKNWEMKIQEVGNGAKKMDS